jgi:hypothetical protein
MKTTRTVLLLLLSCFLLSSDCGKYDYGPKCPILHIDNKTDKKLYTIVSLDYPDTSMNFQNPVINVNNHHINAHSKGKVQYTNYQPCLENLYDNPSNPLEKISVFVFDAALLDAVPWSEIRKNYQVLKRYDLSHDDLVNFNYLIEFR